MSNHSWSNKLSFIITTSAFAVGLGNIWRFPYIAGEGGGGAFLLVYLILVFTIGIPILLIEIGLGRMSKTTTLIGFGKLAGNRIWNGLGWLGIIACLLIMGYYVMIIAWILIYVYESICGHLTGLNSLALDEQFDQISSGLWTIIFVVFGIMASAVLILRKGLQAGLEYYSKAMMIALVFMLLGLAIWAGTLDGAYEGYRYFLTPDFSKINLHVIMTALGQLFFSIGVGMAVAFAFGSYTNQEENLISSTVWIVMADTFFAVVAGLFIFPAIFSYGLSPDSGPNLIFITMASVFGNLYFGKWLGAIFFVLLFLAGFTSLLSSIQALKDSLRDRFKLADLTGLVVVAVIIFAISIPVVYSYSPDPIMIFGMTTFTLLDYVTNTIMLPLGGLMITIFGAYVIGYDILEAQILSGTDKTRIGNHWKYIIKFLVPIALIGILVFGILKF